MTAAENLDLLARQDWESQMKDVLKEAAPQFKVLKKSILTITRQSRKRRRWLSKAKKAAAAAERAARAHGRVRGNRGGRRGRGRGRGRGARGRDTAVGDHGASAGNSIRLGSSGTSAVIRKQL
jgi:hypothetical protein